MQEYQQAIDAFKKSLTLKEDWQTFQRLGYAFYCAKQFPQAVETLKQSLGLKKDFKSYQGLGWALNRCEQYQKAADAFRQSLSLKEDFKSYQGLGSALYNIQEYQQAVAAFKQSLSLQENWESHQGMGYAHYDAQDYPQAIDSFKKSLILKEEHKSYRYLGSAFYELGKIKQGIKATRLFYRHLSPHLNIDPLLGEAHKVSASRDLIQKIKFDLSKKNFAFHPSYPSEIENNNNFNSWKHLIYIHIPKCAGTTFERPISELANYINTVSRKEKHIYRPIPRERDYLWHGNLGGRLRHDAFIMEAFYDKEIDKIQGSFLANQWEAHLLWLKNQTFMQENMSRQRSISTSIFP